MRIFFSRNLEQIVNLQELCAFRSLLQQPDIYFFRLFSEKNIWLDCVIQFQYALVSPIRFQKTLRTFQEENRCRTKQQNSRKTRSYSVSKLQSYNIIIHNTFKLKEKRKERKTYFVWKLHCIMEGVCCLHADKSRTKKNKNTDMSHISDEGVTFQLPEVTIE